MQAQSVTTILASETDAEATPIPTEAICDPHPSNQLAYTVIPFREYFLQVFYSVRLYLFILVLKGASPINSKNHAWKKSGLLSLFSVIQNEIPAVVCNEISSLWVSNVIGFI